MAKYSLRFSTNFKRKYKKLFDRDAALYAKVEQVLILLAENPYSPKLRTHGVVSRYAKHVLSSRVTGDIRVIWVVDEEAKSIIIVLDLGGHSGKNKVYR